MIEKVRNIFAIPELRRKILFTLGILIIVRLGAQVPIPGINPEALRQTMESLNDTFFGLFNMFTGGAFGQAAVFGLGIMPYISCLLYTSPSPRDRQKSRMPSSA